MNLVRVRLPTDSDLAFSSLHWACQLLGETPRLLWVSTYETVSGLFGDIEIRVDDALPCCAWLLQGDTREVYSDGA